MRSSVKVGRRRHADQAGDALRPAGGGQQHDPGAHARADQDLQARGDLVENRERVVAPAADRATGKPARRDAVAGIVEAHESQAARPAMAIERGRLGAAHVGGVAAEEDDSGSAQAVAGRRPPVADCRAIRPCYN